MLNTRDWLALQCLAVALIGRQHDDDVIIVGSGYTGPTIDTGDGTSSRTTMRLDDFVIPEPTQECYDDNWREPLPRPAKVKQKPYRAPRQSFRQSMRSVNRNR